MKNIRNIAILLAFFSVVSLVSYKVGELKTLNNFSGTTDSPLNLSLMWKVRDRLKQTYLDKEAIKDDKMVYGAISGMVASLDDPYTMYLPPTDNKAANEDLAGQFGGVGIQLGYKDKNLAVMAPLAKTPAERAGVMAGDLILKIIDKENKVDKDTSGIALDEAVRLIRGKKGTQVTLKMFRQGKPDAFEVTLTREEIVVPSSELTWKEKDGKKVAWVRLYKFSDQLNKDWPEIVGKIKNEKVKGNFGGIVLDLRNNPGGFLEASVMVASDLLKEGVVVTQQSTNGSKQEYKVDPSKRQLVDDKLVVLVNGGSASAAEILAGALRDYNRAKLVGEKTFGKGTVQQPEDFPDGSGLHVTIAKWLLPSGKNIHKVGVDPDVEVKYLAPTPGVTDGKISPTPTKVVKAEDMPDNQLDKAIEVLLKD